MTNATPINLIKKEFQYRQGLIGLEVGAGQGAVVHVWGWISCLYLKWIFCIHFDFQNHHIKA